MCIRDRLVYSVLLGEYFTRVCCSISRFDTLDILSVLAVIGFSTTAHILSVLAIFRPPVLLHYSQYSQHEINVLGTPSILGSYVATPAAALAALAAAAPLAPPLLMCHPL